MAGPKHVSRKGHRGGSAGLARLRHEFHRFREEVGCIRLLPSLHRRWPSLARLEIDSEASSEDGGLWDSEELPRGISPPATADGEPDGIDTGISIPNLQEFSQLGLESSCSTYGLNQQCANVRSSPVAFDESSAKCANDGGPEKVVVQLKTEDLCDVVQFSLLLSQKRSSYSLGGLKQDSNLDNIEHFKVGYYPVKPISPCEDSARPQDVLETLQKTGELPASQLGNQEEERNCPFEHEGLGTGEDAADVKKCFEDVGNIGLHLFEEGFRRSLHASDVNQMLGNLKEEITGPCYVGAELSFLSSRCYVRGGRDGNAPITYSATSEGQTKTAEHSSVSSYDTKLTELGSVEACFDEEIVDNKLSQSGARTAATAYFTANPHHKKDDHEIPSVPQRHTICQNDGSIQFDIPRLNVVTSTNRKEAELYNLQVLSNFENHIRNLPEIIASPPKKRPTSPVVVPNSREEADGADDEKDPITHDSQVNVSRMQLVHVPVSPDDCKRTLKLVGYVYEEIQQKISAQVPDQPISSKTSSLPTSKSNESVPLELGNQIVRNSMMPAGLDAQRQHGAKEERATVNDPTPYPSQRNTTPTASECDVNGKPEECQGGGISSLIALTGLQSSTRLGGDFKRDSGLAARMTTRIRHALESLGERSRVSDKCTKSSSAYQVTGHKSRLSKGGLAGYRAPSGIGSKVEQNLRFKIESGYPKPIGGHRHRFSEGWISSDASRSAARSSDSVRSEEPETYLQRVIAALESGNESDVQEESDCQRDLSSSSEEVPKKHDNLLHEHPRVRRISSQRHTEEVANVCSSKLACIAHDHHRSHGRFCQLHATRCPPRPLHTGVRPCCHSEVQEELSEHLSSGCSGGPKISCVSKMSPKTHDGGSPKVVRNSGKNGRSADGMDSADPQAFSVKINGPMVEIEVGEEPPSIIWTPRGQNDQSVAVRTSLYQTQEQNTSGNAYTESNGAAISLSARLDATQGLRGLRDFTDPNKTQTNGDPRVVRFRDPILSGKVFKSVRFHSAAKDSGQDKFYSPKQIHESFDRTVNSLARKAQGLGGIEATGEAVSESQQSPKPMPGRLQGEEPSRSILRTSRGASESDSEVQENRRGGQQSTQVIDSIRDSASAVAGPGEIKVRRAKRRSILKIPSRQASSSSDHECATGVYHEKNDVSDIDERKEILEAAAAGLANELQILMDGRAPEYTTDPEERQDDGSSASEVTNYRQRLCTHRPKKLPGHFRPKNRLTGHLRSNCQAGSSYLPSQYPNEPIGRLRSVAKSRQLEHLPENGISVLAGVEGRDRFVHHEAQRQSQRFNSASMRRAKQIVRDTLGDVFDYDQFQQVSSSTFN